MVFRQKDRNVYQVRVTDGDRTAVLSTGCTVLNDAKAVERKVKEWQGAQGFALRRLDVVGALLDKRITLADAYHAAVTNTLDAEMARLVAEAAEVDLHQKLDDFRDWKAVQTIGGGQAEDYHRMLRTLYPKGARFGLREFTRAELYRRLDALTVAGPTKNRYKTAAGQFAKWLVRRGILETNFTRDVEGFGEHPERVVYYERADAKRLIAALPQPFAAIAAAACGYGMEWGTIERALVGDFDLDAPTAPAVVRGSKRSWRHRTVPLVKQNRWIIAFLKPALQGKLPTAKAFEGITERMALYRQQKVATAIKVVAVGEDRFGQHTVHDWRHTHAVQLLRDGYDEQIAAAHLGHKDTDLVRKRYGRFIPTAHDYAKAEKSPLTLHHTGTEGET